MIMQIEDVPAEGALRVWCIINPPRRPIFYPATDADQAKKMINILANEQLKHSYIVSNAFGLEVFEGGEWGEWYSEDGQCITELMDEEQPTP